jgi:hypothetical protein
VQVDTGVWETMQLVEREAAAVPVADDQAAAGCAQIDGDEV